MLLVFLVLVFSLVLPGQEQATDAKTQPGIVLGFKKLQYEGAKPGEYNSAFFAYRDALLDCLVEYIAPLTRHPAYIEKEGKKVLLAGTWDIHLSVQWKQEGKNPGYHMVVEVVPIKHVGRGYVVSSLIDETSSAPADAPQVAGMIFDFLHLEIPRVRKQLQKK